MRSLLLAGTILCATSVAALAAEPVRYVNPPAASSPISGYTSFWLGKATWRVDETTPVRQFNGDFFVAGGDSRVNLRVAPAFSIQGDLEGEATTTGFAQCCFQSDHRVMAAVGGHASWRGMEYLLGAFGGVVGSSVIYDSGEVLQTFAGAEAQAYLGNLTLYGQVGGTWNTDAHSNGMDMMFVRGVARFFLTPNDKLQGEVGYAHGQYSGAAASNPATSTNFGVLYEHKFGGPIALYAEYAGLVTSNTNDINVSEHQLMIGARAYFAPGTLLWNDRMGATLDLPKGTIFRPLIWTGNNS